jgi:hypothetical protein
MGGGKDGVFFYLDIIFDDYFLIIVVLIKSKYITMCFDLRFNLVGWNHSQVIQKKCTIRLFLELIRTNNVIKS